MRLRLGCARTAAALLWCAAFWLGFAQIAGEDEGEKEQGGDEGEVAGQGSSATALGQVDGEEDGGGGRGLAERVGGAAVLA
ncbi:unnamed protein product, partial [Ostreobium quekettii]